LISNEEEKHEFMQIHQIIRERIYSLLDYMALAEMCLDFGLHIPFDVFRKIITRLRIIHQDLATFDIESDHWLRIRLRMRERHFRRQLALRRRRRNDSGIQRLRSIEEVD
jgi:hypothetical protein